MPHSESSVIAESNGSVERKPIASATMVTSPKKLPPPIPDKVIPPKPNNVKNNGTNGVSALPPRPPIPKIAVSNNLETATATSPRPPLPPNAPSKVIVPKVIKRQPPITGSVLSKLAARPEFKSAFAHTKIENTIENVRPIDVALRIPSPSRSVTPTDLDVRRMHLSRSWSNRSLDGSSRCISPASVASSCNLSTISSSSFGGDSSRALTPRRIFPQTYTADPSINMSKLMTLEQSPTIFNGRMSFDLGSNKQRVRQEFRASPAHSVDAETASRYLTSKIESFLKRTDHINEEWRNLRASSKGPIGSSASTISMIEDQRSLHGERLGRSRSVTNIMIKGYRMMKDLPPTERSYSMSRDLSRATSQDTLVDGFDEVLTDNR